MSTLQEFAASREYRHWFVRLFAVLCSGFLSIVLFVSFLAVAFSDVVGGTILFFVPQILISLLALYVWEYTSPYTRDPQELDFWPRTLIFSVMWLIFDVGGGYAVQHYGLFGVTASTIVYFGLILYLIVIDYFV